MDLDFFGTDYSPAAFRLDTAHGRQTFGMQMAHAVAVGHLVKAVLSGDRADFHGFKENVIAGIAGHRGIS